MADHDIERLLEGTFSGDPPEGAFRTRALNASVAAFYKDRRDHVRRRRVQFGLAAAFIAGASFLLGRCAAPSEVTSPMPVAAAPVETVQVSRELVAWLDAACLFKQLGMEERMGRAIDRAGRLRPGQNTVTDDSAGRVFAATEDQIVEEQRSPVGVAILPRLYEPVPSTNGIMAYSYGGLSNANQND